MSSMIPLTILTPIARARAPQSGHSLEALQASGLFDLALVECFGFSEVARARNQVASLAVEPIRARGGLVLWLDADMTFDVDTLYLHAQVVMHTEKAISGRYIKRQDVTAIAAAREEASTRQPEATSFRLAVGEESVIHEFTVELEPAMTGMGALMLPAWMFLQQADSVPTCRRKEKGKDFLERIVCCPRVIAHPRHGHVMLSEDFDYCQSLPGGAWLCEVNDLRSGNRSWLDYGHLAEQVVGHAPKRHVFRDDRLFPPQGPMEPTNSGA